MKITMSKEGLSFDIEPDKKRRSDFCRYSVCNDKVGKKQPQMRTATLFFNGEIGFKTVFDGAEFSLEKVGLRFRRKDSKRQKRNMNLR